MIQGRSITNPSYSNFSTIQIQSPFLAQNAPFWGYSYRGWGQFLYNGGINTENQSDFGTAPIDPTLFDQNTQSTTAQTVNQASASTTPDDVEALSPGLTVRYTLYQQLNGINQYTLPSIKYRTDTGDIDVTFGPNAQNNPVAVLGRFGMADIYSQYVDVNALASSNPNGIFLGLKQYSESHGSAFSANGGQPELSASGTFSTATSQVKNQYIDFNGDRYPDLVTPGAIQFTGMQGGFLQNPLSNALIHESGSDSEDTTLGATISGLYPNSTMKDKELIFDGTGSQINSGINNTSGKTKNGNQWVDINGDGLPDKVYLDTNGNRVFVNLNTGYGFSTQETNWITGLSGMDLGTNSGGSANLSGGNFFPSMSFAVGLGTAQSTSNTETFFTDVNGDGLPDLVKRTAISYVYYLNNGTGFNTIPSTFYLSAVAEQDHNISGNLFGSYTYGFSIPIFGISLKTTFTPTLSTTAGFNEKLHTLQDIDGDGFVDVLHKSGSSTANVSVNLNRVGKTYLLKKVNTPLGGSWTVDYQKSINSYDMPNSKWLLSRVTTNDGFTGDAFYRANNTIATAKYGNPKYDRREREFLGYGIVTTEQRNPADEGLFRYVEDYYHNENYYLSGAKKGNSVFDGSGHLLSNESILYNLLSPDTPAVNFNATATNNYMQYSLQRTAVNLLDHSRLFIAVAKVSSTTYEGQNALTSVKEFLSYSNTYGNLTAYRDTGENPDDAYKTVIDYHSGIGGIPYSPGYPQKISVYNNYNQLLRQRSATFYPYTGGLFEIITKLNATENNKVSLEYNSFGNLTKVNDLENKNSTNTTNYYKTITYETTLNTFPETISNGFGETSYLLNYNYFFGMPMMTRDVNTQFMRTRVDNRGRMIEVTGPNEMAVEAANGGNAWTIRMQYEGENPITTNIASNVFMLNAQGSFSAVAPGAATPTTKQHYALTRHFDPEYATGTGLTTTNQLYTISIADGFGQAIQVKKTHKSLTGTTNTMKWLVSGFDEQDAFGRVVKSHLPVVQTPYAPSNLSASVAFYAPVVSSLSPATAMVYDVKDRPIKVTQPLETTWSEIAYEIDGDRFVQKLTNELGQTLDTYADIRGRQRKTVQNGEITTKFEYNNINELLKVIDNENFETEYSYDLAGRKTEMHHPDRGVVTFKYDKASRMTEQSNSNLLLAGNQKINYYHDFGRLIKIDYPQNPQNQVKYTYGAPGNQLAINERAIGRLLYQEDATGMQVFGYGRMGEVTKNLRSVAVAGYQSFWFFTQWKYDSWNRIQEITYPDQEVVSYSYNEAGALNAINSQITGLTVQPIVTDIKYTDYGERASITHGNGTTTTYSYDTRRRMNNLSHNFSNAGFNITKNYTYDQLSNITKIQTQTPQNSMPGTGKIGGPILHNYKYDDYNRLINADGNYTGANDLTTPYLYTDYTLNMHYNTDHTISKKSQNQRQGTVPSYGGAVSDERAVEKTSYILDYSGYGTGAYVVSNTNNPNDPNAYGYQQPHAVRTIVETPSWVDGIAPDDPRIRHKNLYYDANGNQTEIKETVGALTMSLRKNLWDEENRLKAVNLKPDDPTGHPIAIYTYDAGGARTVRYNYDSIDASSNATEVGQSNKDNVMLYPSGLIMGKATKVQKHGQVTGNTVTYTKHYYIGSERISAKTGTLADFGNYPQTLLGQKMPQLAAVATTTLRTPSNTTVQDAITMINATHTAFGVTPPPMATPTQEADIVYTAHDQNLLNTYYFHPDHLGSSSYITNSAGMVSQHMEYMPFGEPLVDEHLNSNNSPFKFNGKEFDEETGNYYYSARYYDPKLSIFISVDPLAEQTFSSYSYCYNNPINLIDPTGMEGEDPACPGPTSSLQINCAIAELQTQYPNAPIYLKIQGDAGGDGTNRNNAHNGPNFDMYTIQQGSDFSNGSFFIELTEGTTFIDGASIDVTRNPAVENSFLLSFIPGTRPDNGRVVAGSDTLDAASMTTVQTVLSIMSSSGQSASISSETSTAGASGSLAWGLYQGTTQLVDPRQFGQNRINTASTALISGGINSNNINLGNPAIIYNTSTTTLNDGTRINLTFPSSLMLNITRRDSSTGTINIDHKRFGIY